jgi:hypothetical protein
MLLTASKEHKHLVQTESLCMFVIITIITMTNVTCPVIRQLSPSNRKVNTNFTLPPFYFTFETSEKKNDLQGNFHMFYIVLQHNFSGILTDVSVA